MAGKVVLGEVARGFAAAAVTLGCVSLSLAFTFDALPQVRAGALGLEAACFACVLRAPELAALCLPMAVLIGTLAGVEELRRTGQLFALESAGLSPLAPLAPLCAAALAVSAGGYALADGVAPYAKAAALRVIHVRARGWTAQFATASGTHGNGPGPGVFYPEAPAGGRFLAAGQSDRASGELRKVVYHVADARGPGRHSVTFAESAAWEDDVRGTGDGTCGAWVFRKGSTFRLDAAGGEETEVEGWGAWNERVEGSEPEEMTLGSIGPGPRDLALALAVPRLDVAAQPRELAQAFDAMPVARADAAADILAGTTRKLEASALRFKARQRQAVQLAGPILAGLALVLSASPPRRRARTDTDARFGESIPSLLSLATSGAWLSAGPGPGAGGSSHALSAAGQGLALIFLYYLASLAGTLALALGILPWPMAAAYLPNVLGVTAIAIMFPRGRGGLIEK